MYDFNLVRGVVTHTRFDDLDFISRSHVSQSHNVPISVRFLCTVVKWCMFTAHIRKIKDGTLRLTGV